MVVFCYWGRFSFSWGSGEIQPAPGTSGGGSGELREALGSCVVLGKQEKSSPETFLNKFLFEARSRTMPKLFWGASPHIYKIILPQSLRLAIPNLSNVWQITLKDTSLISVTGLVEIMRQSYIAAGSTRDPLFFYCFAAVLYLMLTFLSMKLINRLEVKYSRGF